MLESTNKLLLSSSPPPPPLELLGKPTESFYGIARKRGSAFKSVVVSLGRSPLVSLSLSLSPPLFLLSTRSPFSLSHFLFSPPLDIPFPFDISLILSRFEMEPRWKILSEKSSFPLFRCGSIIYSPPVVQRCTGGKRRASSHDRVHIYVYIYVYTHTDIYTCVVFERTNPLRLKFTFAFADDIYAVFA